MKHKLDLDTWARKVHFNFFKTFEEPYHGACVRIDCTQAYRHAKEAGVPFFFYYLYQSLCAAQRVEPFRLRIQNDDVYVHDHLDAAVTVARDNGTFGYGYIPYRETLQEFIEGGQREVERVKNASDLTPNGAENAILYSVLPWLDFTSISHARVFSFKGTSPFITFGKMTERERRRSMPVSIHVHHALVDGLHVGQYVDCFQELMNAE